MFWYLSGDCQTMNQIKSIGRLNQRELEAGISIEASWHNEYKNTAYIFIGSLPFELTEGDILIIFSQYGIPVHLKLVRDKETGKSKGFGWLKYEDQRSTILAVDNLNGAKVLGRQIRVDHAYYEEKEPDEEYEKLLQEELANDFADVDNEELVPSKDEKVEDDEFQDPLLLMQAQEKQKDEKSGSDKHRSRDHRHHRHHRHEKYRDSKDKDSKDRSHEKHRSHPSDRDRNGDENEH